MNLPTASNILFLYNKVNSLLSPWRRTPAIVSQSSFQAGSFEFHLYAADSPCPNSAGFSRVSLLPRRDPSATWAIKQRERSHFLLITTDCHLSLLPPLHPHSMHPELKISPLGPAAAAAAAAATTAACLLISCRARAHKSTLCGNIQTICSDILWMRAHILYTHTLVTQTLAGHCESTISVVFTYRSLPCYPRSFILPHTDKQWDNPDQNLQLFSWASWAVCYIHLFIFRPYWFMPVRC